MQAARGTSLGRALGRGRSALETKPETTAGAASWPRSVASTRLLFALVFAAAYAVEVLTEVWAVHALTGRPDVRLVGDVLTLHLTRNAGAAFSLGTDYTVVLTCFAIAAALVVLWLSRRLGSRLWAVAFGLLLAGIAGNLTDRMLREPGPFRGRVVDFLAVPHWPVFNVADVELNLAAGLILLQALRGVRLDGRRAGPARSSEELGG